MTDVAFPFKANFPSLYGTDGKSPIVATAIQTVETEWSGIFTLYQRQPSKQAILEGYLVGWWLADLYPDKASGISGDGGMPLTSKSIGGVSVSRKDLEAQPGLRQLESNAFGVKALSMIMAAPERFRIFGATVSPSAARGFSGFPGFGT